MDGNRVGCGESGSLPPVGGVGGFNGACKGGHSEGSRRLGRG